MITHPAIFALYPQVTTINHETAYDKDGNEIEYDKIIVKAKAEELQKKWKNKEQSNADVKQSAIAKLAALGLTEEEIKHIL